MDQAMVIVVLLLGIVLIGVAVVALFTGRKGEQAELNILGVKMSGSGGALFLVVGVVLLFTGKGWSDTLARKGELVKTVVQYQTSVNTLEQRAAALEARVPTPSLFALKQQQAHLFTQPKVILSPRVMLELQQARAKAVSR